MKHATALALNTGVSPGVYAQHAKFIMGLGLPVIPVNGKIPCQEHYNRRQGPPTAQSIVQNAVKYPGADMAILTGAPSCITVIDLDTRDTLDEALKYFGDTPMVVRTGKGWHLFYRHNGERSCELPAPFIGQQLGNGKIVVIPPSAGKSFHLGSWGELNILTKLSTPALTPALEMSPQQVVQQGKRNDALYRHCMEQAPACDDFDALLSVAESFNENCLPELTAAEVLKTARSVWKIETSGFNRIGHPSSNGAVLITAAQREAVLHADWKHAGDALLLYEHLRWTRGAEDKLGKSWQIAARAMAQNKVLGDWPEKKYIRARKVLLEAKLITKVQTGGKGKGDVHKYRFRFPDPVLVSEMDT
jgi:hypothetical protein